MGTHDEVLAKYSHCLGESDGTAERISASRVREPAKLSQS